MNMKQQDYGPYCSEPRLAPLDRIRLRSRDYDQDSNRSEEIPDQMLLNLREK